MHILLLLLLAFISEEGPFRTHPSRAYTVELHGRVAGLCVEECSNAILEGRPVLLYTSRTVLRTGSAGVGDEGKTVWDAAYWIDGKSASVLKARLEFRRGESFKVLEAEFEGSLVKKTTFTQDGEKESGNHTLPEGCKVSCCHAYPALALTKSEKEELTLNVFSLGEGKVFPLTVRYHEDEVLRFHGRDYACRRFTVRSEVPGRNYSLWVTGDGILVMMENPARDMFLRPAGPEIAAKLLSKPSQPIPFVPVETKIPNRYGLTCMELEALMECPDVQGADQLNTDCQSFEGMVDKGRIEGVFRIRSTQYVGVDAPDFYPQSEEAAEDTDDAIRRTAEEATKGLRSRWHAAHAIGAWVRRNISYQPAGEADALRALQNKRAGAAGMARLYVALCRSVGIPARMVVGGIYMATDEAGGFAEHFWSEVSMGDAGWIPMDVTAGELGRLDAGHIRLGETGRFHPEKIAVLDYIPKPEEQREAVETIPSAFPFPPGGTCLYEHYLIDDLVGTERITFTGDEETEGGPLFVFASELEFNELRSKTTVKVGRDGRLHQFKVEYGDKKVNFQASGGKIYCEFDEEGKKKKETMDLPPEGLFFDNQQAFLLGFMLSKLKIEPGQILQLGLFHASSRRLVTLQVEYVGRRKMELEGREVAVKDFDLRQGFHQMLVCITEEGLLVEESEQSGQFRVKLKGME